MPRPERQDDAWIREAVDQFEAPLVQYATRMLGGDRERARDVVQEAFLRLCDQKRDEVAGYLAQWLYTVTRNQALNVRRKESRMTPLADAAASTRATPHPGPQDLAEQRDETRHARQLIDQLPDNQQEVIRLKFQHGLTYRQIQAVTGLSVSTVGYLIHTGLDTVRRAMSPGADPRPSASTTTDPPPAAAPAPAPEN